MAQIVLNVSGNQAIQLGAEEFVRPMAIGNNWQKIRIAVRAMINGSGGMASPRFQIGVCSGAVNTYMSSNCVGWVGSNWPDSNPGYNAGGGYYYYSSGAAVAFNSTKKVGNTVTDNNASSGLQHQCNAVASGRTCIQATDIIRSTTDSTGYYVKPHLTTVGGLALTTDRYTFLRVIEDEIFSSSFASTYLALQGAAGGYLQTGLPQVMDTVSIVWNKSSPTLEICDVTVIRFY